MKTCRHFRNRLPRELADELRDADPLSCVVCDALPHRQHRFLEKREALTVWNEISEASTLIPEMNFA